MQATSAALRPRRAEALPAPPAADWPETYRRLMHDPNDPVAWSALESRVRRWVLHALGSRGWDVVEDAVADVCAAVVLSLGRARGAETFSAFVYGYVLNVLRRTYRAGRAPVIRLGDLDLPADLHELHSGPSDEERAALRIALSELPLRQRRAVIMRCVLRRPAAEIGATLGVSQGNARWLVCDGLSRLRRRLDRPPAPQS